MHLGRMLLIAVALTLVVASVAGNPIPIPSLLMPEEFIDAEIGGPPDSVQAIVDGCYPFANLGHQSVKMLYPVAPASTDIGVWMDGSPLNWWWSHETYPTILPEWPQLPMTEWSISPVPDEFTITAHYEHGVIRRPEEFVFLYPMGTGKYLQTYAKQTTAYVTVDLAGRYLPKGVFRDDDPAPFRLVASGDDWHLTAEVTSAMFQPLLQDFILTFIDRWADSRSWFSQPPDMADGRDIYSSIEVNCLPPADDFFAPASGIVPDTVKLIRWWGSYPGWHDQEARPDVSTYPRPDYFLVRIFDDGATGPGELRYEERIDAFTQTYFGVVVRDVGDGAGGPALEYEHKFEYRAGLSRPFIPLPGQRYWLSIVAGPVACEWAWGWATSPVRGGEPAWVGPCDSTGGPAPSPSTSAGPSGTRDAPMISCTGTESGGDGPRCYSYGVDSASFPMMEFRAGTNDLDRSRYTNVLVPEGWRFAVEARPMGHYHGHKTPHGVVSGGPCRCLTQGSVRWWTDDPGYAVEFFTFGYDHPWVSEDVSWELTTRREGPPPQYYTCRESWDAPVGTGFGPVHGPASDGRVDMAFVLSSAGAPRPMRYRLIEGSTLTEDCDNCGRPPIIVPIRGSFWLHPGEVDPLFSNFAVRRLSFHSLGHAPAYKGAGRGTYRLGGEVARLQQMALEGQINEFKDLHFDSGLVAPQAPFPWIEIDVPQVPPTDPLHIFTLHLVAVPWPGIWFSTEVGFTPAAGGHVSDGDLLSSVGRVVRTNNQLTARLGIMPIVPDIGLDAVGIAWPASWQPTPVTARPEIWFSSELDEFSETLGPLSQGDLLSDAGSIVRRNADLIAPFSPQPPIPDLGLDAVARGPDGRLLFSTESSFFSERLGVTVDDGDLLAEDGTIFRTTAQLMANFQPIDPMPLHVGLDAAYVWPHGEVWFSIETGFSDQRLGAIWEGDLLSDTGRVVYRNLELVGPFEPLERLADFGLDAVHLLWPVVLADFDFDGDVDRDDLEHLVACSSGPTVPQKDTGCRDSDLDGDGDVDPTDFGVFQRCLSGEDNPADPGCQL